MINRKIEFVFLVFARINDDDKNEAKNGEKKYSTAITNCGWLGKTVSS